MTGLATKLDGSEIHFVADVTKMNLELKELPETDFRILAIKEEALKYEVGEVDFEIATITAPDGSELACGCFESLIREQVGELIKSNFAKIMKGDKESLLHLPVESLLPIMILKNLASMSTSFEISPAHLEYGFDPDVAFGGAKKMSPRKKEMLKEIDSQFIDDQEGMDKQAIQIVIDENFINKFLLEMVLVDQSISLTKYLKSDPKLSMLVKSLNTKTAFEKLLPDIYETYGNKRFDVMVSLSHNLIKSKLDGVRVSGFSQDKNGNFRFNFNFFAQILVDRTNNQDWENAREIYLGLTYKGKFVVKEVSPGEKKLIIVHKSAEVSNVKIFKNDEELLAEQMMVTSFLNVQFEQMLTMLPAQEYSLKNPPNPKEMDCLGFRLTDVTLDFKKGFMQMGCGYKTVKVPRDPKVCETFLDMLRNGPQEAMKMARDMYDNP